jgi:hypothetical protein
MFGVRYSRFRLRSIAPTCVQASCSLHTLHCKLEYFIIIPETLRVESSCMIDKEAPSIMTHSHGNSATKRYCIQVTDTRHAPLRRKSYHTTWLGSIMSRQGGNHSFPPKVTVSPLRGRGGSCSCVCGLLGIDEILDRSYLHVISRRLEREDENRFVGE